ncbi:hypothetical protein Csa_011567, partial [Cucumis sativus]
CVCGGGGRRVEHARKAGGGGALSHETAISSTQGNDDVRKLRIRRNSLKRSTQP